MDLFEKCMKFTAVREVMAAGYYPYFAKISSAQEPEVFVGRKRMIMIGSNNYLGLASHPRMKQAAIRAIKRYGTGCAGSPFLNGTLEIHEELEKKIARFKGKEAALVFSTGFLTNLGILSAIVGKRDVVITDRLDHASIIDGCRLSFGRVLKFRHNDMEDLERVLSGVEEGWGKLIVVDGIFSMEGDICRLPEVVRLATRHRARVMLDDAHATGVLGRHGRGTAEHFHLEGHVDLVMGTCSKSFASIGGFVAGREDVIHYLRHNSRALIFSASLPPASVAAISTALDIIEEQPWRRKRLWENTRRMREGLQALGFDTGVSETPIIPVIIGDDIRAFQMWKLLFEEGIFTNPVISPAVPEGRALIRTSYMATHTYEQLDRVLSAFEHVGKKLGIIPHYAKSPMSPKKALRIRRWLRRLQDFAFRR